MCAGSHPPHSSAVPCGSPLRPPCGWRARWCRRRVPRTCGSGHSGRGHCDRRAGRARVRPCGRRRWEWGSRGCRHSGVAWAVEMVGEIAEAAAEHDEGDGLAAGEEGGERRAASADHSSSPARLADMKPARLPTIMARTPIAGDIGAAFGRQATDDADLDADGGDVGEAEQCVGGDDHAARVERSFRRRGRRRTACTRRGQRATP